MKYFAMIGFFLLSYMVMAAAINLMGVPLACLFLVIYFLIVTILVDDRL